MTATSETINSYTGSDPEVKRHVEALEIFIGDMDCSELTDDSTVDASDAVTALNGLLTALAAKDAELASAIERRDSLAASVAKYAVELAKMREARLPTFRCDNCGNGVELEWEFCAWCAATKDWVPIQSEART